MMQSKQGMILRYPLVRETFRELSSWRDKKYSLRLNRSKNSYCNKRLPTNPIHNTYQPQSIKVDDFMKLLNLVVPPCSSFC